MNEIPVCETRVRVRYAETDRMGVVYHANYLVWFEVGRVEWLRQMGFSYREMEEQDDCAIAVVDVHCRYKAPARYDEELIVRTHLKNVRECMVHFGYEVVRADDNALLAEGDPFFYGSSNGSGGGVRIVGRWVLPIVAALVATLALRSVSRREPSS